MTIRRFQVCCLVGIVACVLAMAWLSFSPASPVYVDTNPPPITPYTSPPCPPGLRCP